MKFLKTLSSAASDVVEVSSDAIVDIAAGVGSLAKTLNAEVIKYAKEEYGDAYIGVNKFGVIQLDYDKLGEKKTPSTPKTPKKPKTSK